MWGVITMVIDSFNQKIKNNTKISKINEDDKDNKNKIIENIEINKFDKSTKAENSHDKMLGINSNAGHRLRLKERFLRSPIRTLPDYEILEMLFFKVFNRGDTKALSKKLLQRFGSLAGVMSADKSDLKSVEGIGDGVLEYIKLLQDAFSRLMLPIKFEQSHVLNSWMSVLNYCQFTLGFKKKEYFRALFLNKKNILVADELFDSGTIDRITIYPREIAKLALFHSASSVLIVHNHPSGEVQPSEEDKKITKKIVDALNAVNVGLHDHLIVAGNNHFSFKANALI